MDLWTDISYSQFGVTINILSQEGNSYYVTSGDISWCTCPNFIKFSWFLYLFLKMGVVQTLVLWIQFSMQGDLQ